MKKLVCLLSGLVLLALALPALSADAGPDGLVLDNFQAEQNKLSVTFNHSTHTDFECTACHHTWDPGCGEDPKPCSFSGCHDVMDKRDKSVSSYYLIIHNMRPKEISTCVSCHREQAQGDKEKMRELAGCRGSVCHP
jgi:cytochrome c553